MRYILYISFLFFVYSCSNTTQQSDNEAAAIAHTVDEVKTAVYAFNDAIIAKDTVKLNNLLHDKLSYGHSNGWCETKTQQTENLFNGTITYHKIEQPEVEIMLSRDVATVRGDGIFDVDYKEYEHMIFNLHVMQTWVWTDGRWQMLNRQSVSNE